MLHYVLLKAGFFWNLSLAITVGAYVERLSSILNIILSMTRLVIHWKPFVRDNI